MPSASSSNGHTHAQKPSDRIWEHQLRRENKALLEQIRELASRCEANHADDEKRRQEAEEKLEQLEEKLLDLQRRVRESEELNVKRSKEQQVAMSSMKDALKARPPNERRFPLQASSGATMTTTAESQSPRGPPVPPKPSTSNARNGARPMPIIGPPPQLQSAIANSGEFPNPFATVPPVKKPSRSEKPAAPNRRPVTRSSMTRDSPEPTEPVDAVPAPSNFKYQPMQGTMSIKNYYLHCGNHFKTLPSRSTQSEIDYIMAFIKGINQKKARDKLMGGLQQLHPSRMGAKGEMEILCEWEEVQEGLQRVGMWETSLEKESKKRKRMLGPRGGQIEPRGMVETGF